MISEGPCDTDDWSNNAKNTVLLYLSDKMNAALVSIRDSFKINV